MAATKRLSDEELADLEGKVEAERAERAKEERAELVERFRPLNELLASKEFGKVRERLAEISPAYLADQTVAAHLIALPQIFDALDRVAGSAREPEQAPAG